MWSTGDLIELSLSSASLVGEASPLAVSGLDSFWGEVPFCFSSFSLTPINLDTDFLNLLLKLVFLSMFAAPSLGRVPPLVTSSSFDLNVAGRVLVLLKVSRPSSLFASVPFDQ